MEVVEERLVMYAELPSGLVYYNCPEDIVENQLGYVIHSLRPSVDMINRYWLQFDRLSPPSLIVRVIDGQECVSGNRSVIYDRENRKYVHEHTEKVLYGYRPKV
jgi:hypothetical protein